MLVLLLVLQRFGRRQWGYISELTTEDHTVWLHPINADGSLGTDEVGVGFHPEDKVHSHWALLGRATTVFGANRNKEDDSGTAGGKHAEAQDEVKGSVVGVDSRTDSQDTQEGTDPDCAIDETDEESKDYYRARDEYREAREKTIKMHNLVLKVSWPETSRVEEWKIVRRAQALGVDDKFIRGHIPEVKYARDLGRYSTRHIRDFLGLQSSRPGTRTLRLIVMGRLRPIYDLDREHFWKAFWQCVACTDPTLCFRTLAHAIGRSFPVVGTWDPPWGHQLQQPDVQYLRHRRSCRCAQRL